MCSLGVGQVCTQTGHTGQALQPGLEMWLSLCSDRVGAEMHGRVILAGGMILLQPHR